MGLLSKNGDHIWMNLSDDPSVLHHWKNVSVSGNHPPNGIMIIAHSSYFQVNKSLYISQVEFNVNINNGH